MTKDNDKPWKGDFLGREEIANNLLNYVLSDESHAHVVNINAPWGTGKTFLLENIQKQLKDSAVVININAWKDDFNKEPMPYIISCIFEQIKNSSNTLKTNADLNAFLSKGAAVLSMIGKTGIRYGLRQLNLEPNDFEEILKASDTTIEKYLKEKNNRDESIDAFKVSLEKLIKDSITHNDFTHKKALIMIDELDRCRPTYAIEMLECVKHFFDIRNCVFLISTDTEQLEHSIRAVYGAEFKSNIYLKRFFDLTFSLDEKTTEFLIENESFFSYLKEDNYLNIDIENSDLLKKTFKRLIITGGLSTRDVISINKRLEFLAFLLKEKFEPVFCLIFIHTDNYSKTINHSSLSDTAAAISSRDTLYEDFKIYNSRQKKHLNISTYLKIFTNICLDTSTLDSPSNDNPKPLTDIFKSIVHSAISTSENNFEVQSLLKNYILKEPLIKRAFLDNYRSLTLYSKKIST